MFREFYPKEEECITMLDCVWKTDKYVLLETLQNHESSKPIEENVSEDATTRDSLVQYKTSVSSLGGKKINRITSWFLFFVPKFECWFCPYYLDLERNTHLSHTCI